MQFKIPEHKKKFKKGGINASADLYWQFLLLIALIIVIASCVLGAFLFLRVNKGSVFEFSDDASETNTISEKRINNALEYFSGREKRSAEILSSPSPLVDPSL